jgi:hypothetical protein
MTHESEYDLLLRWYEELGTLLKKTRHTEEELHRAIFLSGEIEIRLNWRCRQFGEGSNPSEGGDDGAFDDD